jgi:hypothetical protein
MKNALFWLVLLAIVYGLLEGLSAFGLKRLEQGALGRPHSYYPADTLSARHRAVLERMMVETPPYGGFDAELGWSIQPGGRIDYEQRRSGRNFSYIANAQGFRANREYDHEPPADMLRVAAFGDSFTHCDDVGYDDCWIAAMMARDPGLEVLNFGVGGYGPDQAYLRYQRLGQQFDPDIVLIGFMSENIRRSVNVYRPFYLPDGGQPMTKPRFRIVDGELVLLPNPMQSLADYQRLLDDPATTLAAFGENDMIYQVRYRSGPFDFSPTVRLTKLVSEKLRRRYIGDGIVDRGIYNTDSEAFAVVTAIMDAFYAEAIAHGSIPIIVLFAGPIDLNDYAAGKPRRYRPLIDHLDGQQYRYVDTLDPLVAGLGTDYEAHQLFVGHYSRLANNIVAGAVVDYLESSGVRDEAAVARQVAVAGPRN